MVIAVPFNFGQLRIKSKLNRAYWMFYKSIRCWSYLANQIGASIVVPTTLEFANDLLRFVPVGVKVVVINKDRLPEHLWNEIKFSFVDILSEDSSILICDYDIVFTKTYANKLIKRIKANKDKVGFFCRERSFDDIEPGSHNAYSYGLDNASTCFSINKSYNAGIIYAPSYLDLCNEFFRGKQYCINKLGIAKFREKGLFLEGYIEQLLLPYTYISKKKFFLLDNSPSVIGGDTHSNVCHLFGIYKNDPDSLKSFSQIYFKNNFHEKFKVLQKR